MSRLIYSQLPLTARPPILNQKRPLIRGVDHKVKKVCYAARLFFKESACFAVKPSKNRPFKKNASSPHGKPAFKARAQAPREKKPGASGLMLFGLHACREAWLNPKRRILHALFTPQGEKLFEETLAAGKRGNLKRPTPERTDGFALERTLPQGAVHQGIALEVEGVPEVALDDMLDEANENACFVVLDQVTDPHNVGAIVRTACAFGAKAVIVTERHAPQATGTLAKAACGALEHTPIVRIGNMVQALEKMKKAGFWCIGLDETGSSPLHALSFPARVALVMGAEGEGLRRLTMENCDEIARLPTHPPIGSLNVSNAAAVAIYEVMRAKN